MQNILHAGNIFPTKHVNFDLNLPSTNVVENAPSSKNENQGKCKH